MATIVAGAVAGLAIISQLQSIYAIIDSIRSRGQHVVRHKDICAKFADFVEGIRRGLKEKASILEAHKEARFSAEAKRQLDKLRESLTQADVLLGNLKSWTRIANYTGGARSKIQELRQEIHESFSLLTFHMVGPSPERPSPHHNQQNNPHPESGHPTPSHHHSNAHQQNSVLYHQHPPLTHYAWSPLHPVTQAHFVHIPSHFPSPGRPGYGPAPAQNMFYHLNPYRNPSAEYASGFRSLNVSQK
ncbi:hypothetical protein R1flu_015438 [Riccia fluitans]|uniref:Uncharacterized protein n=1 Tax=Riccia fluitans TaxID=41844 RepID=A0ABD1YJ31_9MARC